MSKVIYKYAFAVDLSLSLEMPKGAEIIHVEPQGFTPTLWALVDPAADKEIRHFAVVGTGQPMPDTGMAYRGSWVDAPYVWHLFEIVP